MEILQNLWTTLTTPNTELVKILTIPLGFLEAFLSMLLFTTLLNISGTKKQKLLYVLIGASLALITSFIIPSPFDVFINFISIPLLVIIIFKVSIIKGIIAEVIPILIIALLENPIIKIFDLVFNISFDQILNVTIYRLSYILFIDFILFLIYKLIKFLRINLPIVDNMNKKSKLLIILTFICGIITVCLQIYLFTFYSRTLSMSITLISTVTIFSYFAITMYSLTTVTKLETTSQDLEESKLYNKTLSILHDNIRCFKHDFNNIVQVIGGYVATDDISGLKNYYSQLLEDCQRVNNLSCLNPTSINHPAIYSLLTSKYHKADEQGIKINLEVFLDLNTLNMKIYEFTKILGILLDNAIEASSQCEEKIINVTFRKDSNKNMQILIIENTYAEKDIDVAKIFDKGYTSKPNNTGLGLWEINSILKKNKNIELFTTKTDKFFKQELQIYI